MSRVRQRQPSTDSFRLEELDDRQRTGAITLAECYEAQGRLASALCPNQAFRLAGAPVYGAQFHVELDRERMLDRASVYREEYLADHGAMESLERALRPSPESATLLRRFLERVVAAQGSATP